MLACVGLSVLPKSGSGGLNGSLTLWVVSCTNRVGRHSTGLSIQARTKLCECFCSSRPIPMPRCTLCCDTPHDPQAHTKHKYKLTPPDPLLNFAKQLQTMTISPSPSPPHSLIPASTPATDPHPLILTSLACTFVLTLIPAFILRLALTFTLSPSPLHSLPHLHPHLTLALMAVGKRIDMICQRLDETQDSDVSIP